MTQPAKVTEPSMEEILASIRRIIADDEAKPPPAETAKPEKAAAPAAPPKPQVMNDVFQELAGQIKPSTLVVSIAAGITLDKHCRGLHTERVIRVMPNTP